MPRPRNIRQVNNLPCVDYFKPRGIPMSELEEVILAVEELEALRLADLEGLEQAQGAEQMGISRSTFARVVYAARAKVADALVNSKALRIDGGAFRMADNAPVCGRHGHRRGHGRGRGWACQWRPGPPETGKSEEQTLGTDEKPEGSDLCS